MMQPIQIEFDLETLKSDVWFWAQLLTIKEPPQARNRWMYQFVEVIPADLGQQEESWFIRDVEFARTGWACNTLEWNNAGSGVMGSGDWVPVRVGTGESGNCPGVSPELQPLGSGAVVRMTQYRYEDREMFFFSAPNNISEKCTPYQQLTIEDIPTTEPYDSSD